MCQPPTPFAGALEVFIQLWMGNLAHWSSGSSCLVGGFGSESCNARTGRLVSRCSPIWAKAYRFPRPINSVGIRTRSVTISRDRATIPGSVVPKKCTPPCTFINTQGPREHADYFRLARTGLPRAKDACARGRLPEITDLVGWKAFICYCTTCFDTKDHHTGDKAD